MFLGPNVFANWTNYISKACRALRVRSSVVDVVAPNQVLFNYCQRFGSQMVLQVRVLENYGEFETSDGNLVMLHVNSTVSIGQRS